MPNEKLINETGTTIFAYCCEGVCRVSYKPIAYSRRGILWSTIVVLKTSHCHGRIHHWATWAMAPTLGRRPKMSQIKKSHTLPTSVSQPGCMAKQNSRWDKDTSFGLSIRQWRSSFSHRFFPSFTPGFQAPQASKWKLNSLTRTRSSVSNNCSAIDIAKHHVLTIAFMDMLFSIFLGTFSSTMILLSTTLPRTIVACSFECSWWVCSPGRFQKCQFLMFCF